MTSSVTYRSVYCLVFVNNNTANSLLMNFDCPVDTSSSTHSCHAELAPNQLPRFHCQKDQWPQNSPDLNPLDHHVWGQCWSQAPSETENDRRTELKEVLEVIWDSLPQGPIDKAVKEFSKRLKACVAAEGGHFEHSQ